jgi:hypothetical protein
MNSDAEIMTITPSSGQKHVPHYSNNQLQCSKQNHLLPAHAGFLLDIFFDSEGAGNMLLRNVRRLPMDYMNGFCRLCFRLRAALLCWFSLSFTTCFGLHGHLQVCKVFICLKASASLLFFLPFFHVVTLCTFPFVFFLFCFPS